MNIAFERRIVIVTGAAHGFGRAIAQGFAERGATVHGFDLNRSGTSRDACALRTGIRRACRRCRRPRHCSGRRSPGSFRTAAPSTYSSTTPAACAARSGRPIEEISESDWRTIFDVNLSGAVLHEPGGRARHENEALRPASSTSPAAPGSGISLTGIQAYASAKAGQIGLTRQLARELGPWNVTVNNVAPGLRALQPDH